jgi:anaerobic magnesium-protoporphyrin IX monomethyl ester cyclase
MNLDCLLCSLPPLLDDSVPFMAPHSLSGLLKANGYNSKVIDFNKDFIVNHKDIIFPDMNKYEVIEEFINKDKLFLNDKLVNLLDKWVKDIISINPEFIGISIFTTYTSLIVSYIIKNIKKHSNIKIIIGGGGTLRYLEVINNKLNLDLDLIDHIVIGHGEEALLDIISKKSSDKFYIKFKSNFNLNQPPDFSDLDLSMYEALPSFQSIGCSFNCPFCTLSRLYEYSIRPPSQFLNEIKVCKEKYNINKYRLLNSLFDPLSNDFENTYNQLKDLDVEWFTTGWRIRKNIPKSNYKLLKESGCISVNIGIESGSKKVRYDMRKYFSNKTMFENLENLSNNGIRIHMTLITGYPTETEEDFKLTLDLIENIKKYNISNLSPGRLIIKTLELEKYKKCDNVLAGPERLIRLQEKIDSINNFSQYAYVQNKTGHTS